MRQRVVSVVLAALSTMLLAASPALADTTGGPGAAKEGLVGPHANVFCDGLAPFPGEDISQPGPGSVVFSQDRTANTVSANVVVKGGVPNTTYVIRLLQNDGSDCQTVDALLHTNARGNGEAQAIDVIDQGATAVNVFVVTRSPFGPGLDAYRAPDNYTLVSSSGKP